MSENRLSLSRFVLVSAVIVAVTGCSQGATPDEVMAMYATREHNVARLAVEHSLADLLPNKTFSVDGSAQQQLAENVVVGVIAEVTEGSGYVIAGEDAPTGTLVPFSDRRAWWRTIDVTLNVEEAFGEGIEDGDVIRFALPLNASDNAASVMKGIASMGKVVVVLDEPGRFAYDKALYSVHWDGVFVAPITDDGAFTFAALGESAPAFQNGLDSVEELRREALRPTEMYETDSMGIARSLVPQ
jgi:hypothetical protein